MSAVWCRPRAVDVGRSTAGFRCAVRIRARSVSSTAGSGLVVVIAGCPLGSIRGVGARHRYSTPGYRLQVLTTITDTLREERTSAPSHRRPPPSAGLDSDQTG